jgi:hypothetical protein
MLSADLAQILVQMCAGVLAGSHPDQALVRLHHLARRDRGDRVGAVAELRNLAGADRRLLRLLLSRCADNLGEQANTRRADLAVFPRAVDPRGLLGPHPVVSRPDSRDHLVSCWRAVLTHGDAVNVAAELQEWLDVGAGGGQATALLEVLVAAAAGRFRPIAVLTAAIRRWERDGGGVPAVRERTAAELIRSLERTQGLGVHDWAPQGTTGENHR